MADNRTGLSAADIAEQFRDMCGDGSIEWVTGPMQTWLLLDAADMLDEFADAPKCETCEAMLDCDECLRADALQKERRRLDYENAKLRELVQGIFRDFANADAELKLRHGRTFMAWRYEPRLRELGMEVVE